MSTICRSATLLTLTCTLLLVSAAETVRADEVAPKTPFGQMMDNLNPANWKMPKMPKFQTLMPQTQEKARIKKKKDGLVDEVGKTASSSWTRTKEAFNPQKLNPVNFFSASSRTPTKTVPTETKPNFFQSLFAPAVPKDENATTSSFLKLDRPAP